MAAAKGVKVKCSGCQRKVEVPEGILANLPEPDDDDDFLSGVPMVASGDEDVLTEADLAIESGETPESSDLAAKPNLLDCLLYTSPSPRDATLSRMPSSA